MLFMEKKLKQVLSGQPSLFMGIDLSPPFNSLKASIHSSTSYSLRGKLGVKVLDLGVSKT